MSELESRQEQPGKPRSFSVCGCKVEVKQDAEGKEHFEATCASKANRDKLAAIFEQEAILRVNPKVILDDTPPAEPEHEFTTVEEVTTAK